MLFKKQNNLCVRCRRFIRFVKNLFEIDAYSAFTDGRKAINIFYNELTSVLDMAAYFKLDEKTGL